jgi:hypothetical protein
MHQCQDEILVSDLEAAAFICVTTVEALTHALVINDCGHSLTEEEDAVEHVTRLLAGYLSIAPEPLRPILKSAGSLPG